MEIAPEGTAVGVSVGEPEVTWQEAVERPLYAVDADIRVWDVPAENRIYEAE